MSSKSLDFYNQFDKKLINDYINQNRRIESAIVELARFIPESSSRILDIGCGLGWSSHEFASHFPHAHVDGIDLSPILIETASKLFSLENLKYTILDITKDFPEKKYDAIVMIDVYEHIPLDNRNNFHKGLLNILSINGRLLLACPTKYHQDWLRNNEPEGLQPVDEDVDASTILKIARDLNAEVVFFSYQNIWRNYDYIYAVIERSPVYNSKFGLFSQIQITLESVPSRVNRVYKKLNIRLALKEKKKTKKSILVRLKSKILKMYTK